MGHVEHSRIADSECTLLTQNARILMARVQRTLTILDRHGPDAGPDFDNDDEQEQAEIPRLRLSRHVTEKQDQTELLRSVRWMRDETQTCTR